MNRKNIVALIGFCFVVCIGALFVGCSYNIMRVYVYPEKKSGLVVINVLDKALYDDCHIKGSVHVPFESIEKYAQQFDPEQVEIVVYCSNYFCTSSGYACKLLKDKGFKHVWAYEGGIAEWYQMGFPVEGACQQAYLSKKIAPLAQDESQDTITVHELLMKMREVEKAA